MYERSNNMTAVSSGPRVPAGQKNQRTKNPRPRLTRKRIRGLQLVLEDRGLFAAAGVHSDRGAALRYIREIGNWNKRRPAGGAKR